MPKIPIYERQLDNNPGLMPTNYTAYDRTNVTAAYQAMADLGYVAGKMGENISYLGNKIETIKQQDKNIFMQQNLENLSQSMHKDLEEIDAVSGQEKLDKINQFKKTYQGYRDTLNLQDIVDNSSGYYADRIKNNGITELDEELWSYQKDTRINNTINRLIPIEAREREKIDIQTAQTENNNITYDLLKGNINIDTAKENILNAYNTKNLPLEKKEMLAKESIGDMTTLYIEDGFSNDNREIVDRFNNGEFDKKILGMTNGARILTRLKHESATTGEIIIAKDIANKFEQSGMVGKAAVDELTHGELDKQIDEMKGINDNTKQRAKDIVYTRIQKEQQRISDYNRQQRNSEIDDINASIASQNWEQVITKTAKAKYLNHEDKSYYTKAAKEATDVRLYDNPELTNLFEMESLKIDRNTDPATVKKLIMAIEDNRNIGISAKTADKLIGDINKYNSGNANEEYKDRMQSIYTMIKVKGFITSDVAKDAVLTQKEIQNQLSLSRKRFDSFIKEGSNISEAYNKTIESFQIPKAKGILSEVFSGVYNWATDFSGLKEYFGKYKPTEE